MTGEMDMQRAKFHSMEACTREDWAVINQAFTPFANELPDRVLRHLRLLEGDCGVVDALLVSAPHFR